MIFKGDIPFSLGWSKQTGRGNR